MDEDVEDFMVVGEDVVFDGGGDEVSLFDGEGGVDLEVEVDFKEVADFAGTEVVVGEGAWGGEDVFRDVADHGGFRGFVEEVF